MDSKPGGRRTVWAAIALVLLLVIIAFAARPLNFGGGSERQAAQSNPAAPAQPARQP